MTDLNTDNTLVILNDSNTPVTDSLKVAEYFGKEHKHVMRDIRDLIDRGVSTFGPTPYVHPQNGQTYQMYVMDQNAWMLLVFGFNGDKAFEVKERFLKAFNKMEATIKDQAGEIKRLTAVCERLEAAVERIEAPTSSEIRGTNSDVIIVDEVIPEPEEEDVPEEEDEKDFFPEEIVTQLPVSIAKALTPLGLRPRIATKLFITMGFLEPYDKEYTTRTVTKYSITEKGERYFTMVHNHPYLKPEAVKHFAVIAQKGRFPTDCYKKKVQ